MARKRIGLILGIFFLAVFAAWVVWLFPAYRFLQVYRARLSSQESPPAVSKTEIQIAELGISAHLYQSRDPSHTTVILVPGLHPFGHHDPRFILFAETVTKAGFQVLAPDIPDFRQLKMTTETVDLLATLIQVLPHYLPASSLKNLGILGVSYGAGPSLIALARQDTKQRVQFFVAIGGYYNLRNTIEFTLSGNHPQRGKNSSLIPHQWGRLIFTWNHLHELVAGPDSDLLRESLQLRLNLREKNAEEKEKNLSPQGKEFLRGILHGLSPQQLSKFQSILRQETETANKLSPEYFLQAIDPALRVYLLHGKLDDLIPYEESKDLAKALKESGHPMVNTLILDSWIHVDETQSPGGRDFLRLLWWTRKLLAEAH